MTITLLKVGQRSSNISNYQKFFDITKSQISISSIESHN